MRWSRVRSVYEILDESLLTFWNIGESLRELVTIADCHLSCAAFDPSRVAGDCVDDHHIATVYCCPRGDGSRHVISSSACES
jgi:hypothetical protein